jgi:hypothetical protein
MFVGNSAGEVLVVHLPSRSVVVRSAVHPGPVERVVRPPSLRLDSGAASFRPPHHVNTPCSRT